MIETSTAFVSLLDTDVLRIEFKPDVYVDVEQFEENLQAYKTLMTTDRVFLVTVVGAGASMSLEVRNQFSTKERSAFKIAEAFVINTLAHKIVADFVLRVQRPHHKVSVFFTEEKAVEWIMRQREEYNADRKKEPEL